MNNSTYRFSLDLDKQDSQEYVTVRKGDTAKSLSVMIKESGTPYIIAAGATVTLSAKKPDGTYITADCTAEDNRINVVLPATFTANIGEIEACFGITDGSAALYTPPFTICVSDKPMA